MESWIDQINGSIPWTLVGRLVLAIVAGAIIGWDRERRVKPAGLRTHMLVALGAGAFMIGAMDESLAARLGDQYRLDPVRVLAAIIGGVGFLGAGTIIQSRGSVHGITTAASIWVSAAVGASCGMGLYWLAAVSSVFALTILWGVGALEIAVFSDSDLDKKQQPSERAAPAGQTGRSTGY